MWQRIAAADNWLECFLLSCRGLEEENLGYDIGMQGRQLYECAIMDTVVVLPEYRGMHLQYEMMQTAERKLHKEGYRYLLCTVHPENKFSRGECEKTGIQKNTDKRKIWWIFAGYLDERTVKYLKLRLVAERQLPLQNGNKDCD